MVIGIIITVLVVSTVALAISLERCSKSKQEVESEVARHREYMKPVTQDAINEFLQGKEIQTSIIDENTLTFENGDIYVVDTERLPMLHIKTGISLSEEGYNWEMIKASAAHVQDDVVMIETSFNEGKYVEFHISCCEMNMGHLIESWEYYSKIFVHSKGVFIQGYNQLHDASMNENHMKKDSPAEQIERITQQMIAAKTEEAESNSRRQSNAGKCAS